uniref:Uncharacterized protein n=1 Tax=Oryza brachyantha TaxID=4533 RepID=J3MDP7_ORYBR
MAFRSVITMPSKPTLRSQLAGKPGLMDLGEDMGHRRPPYGVAEAMCWCGDECKFTDQPGYTKRQC